MAKQTKAQREAAKQRAAIQARAEAIMEEAGVGYVKALIRARKEAGILSRFELAQREAAAAEGASA